MVNSCFAVTSAHALTKGQAGNTEKKFRVWKRKTFMEILISFPQPRFQVFIVSIWLAATANRVLGIIRIFAVIQQRSSYVHIHNRLKFSRSHTHQHQEAVLKTAPVEYLLVRSTNIDNFNQDTQRSQATTNAAQPLQPSGLLCSINKIHHEVGVSKSISFVTELLSRVLI